MKWKKKGEKMKAQKYLYPATLISGLFLGLSVILPDVFGFVAWFALLPFFLCFIPLGERITTKSRCYFLSGFLFYFAYGLTCFHWFWALFPLDFTGLSDIESIVVILLAWIGLSALYALFGGLIFLIPVFLYQLGVFRRSPVLSVAVLPTLFVLYEFVLTLDWWGVPWGKVAMSQTFFLPALQTASLFGSYFICALIVLFNASLAFLLIHRKKMVTRTVPFALATLCVILNTLCGVWLYQKAPAYEENAPTVKIAVLQGNNPSQEDISDIDSFDKYLALATDAALAGADVILFPESTIAGAIYEDNYYGKYASQFASTYEVNLIIGSTTYRDGNEYNTMTYFDREGKLTSYYDKRRLVPFGEFVPYRAFFETFIPPLVEVTMLDQDCTEGEDPAIFETDSGNLGTLICFESIYERLALDTVREGAEVFVVGTNDSWFRKSLATIMHTAHEQLRSIECGRYSTRAACTGLTCIINSRGELVDSLPLYEEGFLLYDTPRLSHTTLYARVGDLVVPLCCLSIIASFFYGFLGRKKEKTEQ